MAGQQRSKLKILYLLEIFWRKTDETSILDATEICELLGEYGVEAERKSIYSDINNLRTFGLNIVNTRTPVRGYYLASRIFEPAELRLLIDAVQAAFFISKKKSRNLIKKLNTLASENQASALESCLYSDNKVKCLNEDIYFTIDVISEAINLGKQITFHYIKRKVTLKMAARNENKQFTVSPYALIWCADRYYLVCNHSKYDNLMHVRLDRIVKVNITDKPVRSFEEVSDYRGKFNCADYTSKLFNMFSGENDIIELRCSNTILQDILDRFGNDVPLKADGDDHFLVRQEAALSQGLVSWIMQYGEMIRVIEPRRLVESLKNKAESILDLYSKTT